MKQAVMVAPGKIEFRAADAPVPGAGEVLLRIKRIGICGSDVHVYHGRHPYTSYPVIQGHEFAAVVEAVGAGVTGLRAGQKVTAMPQVVCGACRPCRRGDYHICEHLKVQGFQADGVAQELFVTGVEKVIPLPASFSLEQGALVEPVSVAVHAVGRAGEVAGRNVAVLGAGPIGNLTAQVARAAGANVLITDLSDHRLEVARSCGIASTANAGAESLGDAAGRVFGKDGFDVAFECAGAEQAISAAVENVSKGGTIVVVGVFGEKPAVDLGLVQDRELTLIGTLMYKKEDYEGAVAAIEAGSIVTDPLVSRHFDFADFLGAYRHIEEAGPETMKVFIDL